MIFSIKAGIAAPEIIITATPLTQFITPAGNPSEEQSYFVEGTDLTESIIINAPTDFEISTLSGSGFGSSITLNPTLGVVAQTSIYVRFNKADAGSSYGNIIHSTSGATGQAVAVEGKAYSTITFQEGLNSYSGTIDTYIWSGDATNSYGSEDHVEWDGSTGGYPQHALVRFKDLFGPGFFQIPEGSEIFSAILFYYIDNEGDDASVHEILIDWDESVAWNSFGANPGPVSGTDFNSTLLTTATGSMPIDEFKSINVTSSLFSWSSVPTSNFGWIFNPDGNDGVDFKSSDHITESHRPKLTVEFVPPPQEWIALNDLNSSTGDLNASYVSEHDYTIANGALINSTSGQTLPLSLVNISGNFNTHEPHTGNGSQCNSGTDAALIFGPVGAEIVDLKNPIELDEVTYYNTIIFNNLDPTQLYEITLTANRAEPSYTNRWTKVSIEGTETFTNISTSGVSVADPGNFSTQATVSFCTGHNTVNGYVARWTNISVGSDGSFAVKSEKETSYGGSGGSKGYAMGAFRLEQIYVPPVPPNAPSDLITSQVTYNQIDLSWTDNSDNELIFEIFRSISGTGGTYSILSTVETDVTSYSDVNLDPNSEYCYKVRASNTVNYSNYSNTDCSSTPTESEYALDFGTADSYITFGDPDALDLSEFTIETWFKREGTGITANTDGEGMFAIPLVTKGVGESETSNVDMNYFLGIHGTNNVIAADFEEGSTGSNPSLNHPVEGTTPILNDTWYHAAVSYDGNKWAIYLNGELENELIVGEPVASQSIQHAGLAAAINSTGIAEGHFDGVLDEVRIWNYARSKAEILGTINMALSTPHPALVARWALNEGLGSNVYGSTGTLINGIIQNSGYSWVAGAPFNILINNPPNSPELVEPPDMATEVPTSPTLSVTVSDPEANNLTVTFYGRKKVSSGNDFTIVGLPDTQFYSSEMYGGTASIFNSQTQWIVDNLAIENIVFVSQLGDCVQNGDEFEIEWQRADTAISLIENPVTTFLTFGMPYGIAVGNHDQTPTGHANGTTNFYNSYFGESRFSGRDYYGGHFGLNNDNHFQLFSAAGMDFIVIHLEYDTSPDTEVLSWVENLLDSNRERRAIIVSHYLINIGNPGSFGPQGQATYDVVKEYDNVFLMLCGHMHGEGQRTDTYNDNTIHSVLSDYQSRANGGNGWMRLMKFSPSNNTISVRTYSPWLNQFETDLNSQFTLDYQMTDPWELIGTNTAVSSGSISSIVWPALNPLTEYEWYVTVDDGNSIVPSDTWSFTTADEPQTFTVEITISGNGTVIKNPDQMVYNLNDMVELIAIPDEGSDFIAWEGDLTGTVNPETILVNTNLNITAVFSLNNALIFDGVDDYVSFGKAEGPDGTFVNTPAWVSESGITPAPPNNYSLQFSSSTHDYVTFGEATNELGTASFTAECWFKRTGAGISNTTGGGVETMVPLISKGAPEEDGSNLDANYILGIQDGGSGESYIAGDFEDTGGDPNNHPKVGSTPIILNTWYHAALTFNNTTKEYALYLNGELEGSIENLAGISPRHDSQQHAALATMLESNGTTSHGFFEGLIDEPRIWDRALSQTEIQNNMNAEIERSSGLVGRWGLNEGSGTITYQSANSLGLTNFTIETWFKCEGSGIQAETGNGGLEAIPLVTKGREEDDGNNLDMNFFLGINNNAALGTLNVLAADFEDLTSSNNNPVYGSSAILDDIWYHAAATYDGTTWNLYLNGILDGTSFSGNTPRFDCIQHAALATALNSSGQSQGAFNGTIDEVRIWNYARTEEEIRTDMHRELVNPYSESGLIAYYDCDMTSGSILPDNSINNISGTLLNMDPSTDWIVSTAPIPYYTITDGEWGTDATWESGQLTPINSWARIMIKNNLTQNSDIESIDITILPSGRLIVNPGFFLTVSGNLVNDAGISGLELKSDETGMASLIHNNNNIEASTELYLTHNEWHYVSSPIYNALSGVFTGIYLRTFDEFSYSWNPYITSTTEPLETMLGYAAWVVDNPTIVDFEGVLNNDIQSINISNLSLSDNKGWNLVGNPFASSLDWNGSGWIKTDIDNTIYFWSGIGGGGGGNYHYYVGTGGLGPIPPVPVNDGTNEIPPMQGFFVKASDNGILRVNNEARIHSSQDYYKETDNEIPLIRLLASGIDLTDEAVIRFYSGAGPNYDGNFDAFKLIANEYPQIYSITEDEHKLAVNTLTDYNNETIIPVGFIAPNENDYQISMTECIEFDFSTKIYLEDLKTGVTQEITQNPVYEFNSSPLDDPSRFLLKFSDLVGVENNSAHEMQIYSYRDIIYILFPEPDNSEIEIFNLLGQKVHSCNMENEYLKKIPIITGTGNYVVKVKNAKEFVAKKVFINN